MRAGHRLDVKDPGKGITVNGKDGVLVCNTRNGSAHHGCFELEVLEVERSLIFSTPCMTTSIASRFRQTREFECGDERTWQSSWVSLEPGGSCKVRVKSDLKQSGHLSCRPTNLGKFSVADSESRAVGRGSCAASSDGALVGSSVFERGNARLHTLTNTYDPFRAAHSRAQRPRPVTK